MITTAHQGCNAGRKPRIAASVTCTGFEPVRKRRREKLGSLKAQGKIVCGAQQVG
jgi:hypothetical protein